MAFCSNCGAPLEEGAKFCPSCGSPVGAAQPTPEPSQDEQPSYEQEFYAHKQSEGPRAPYEHVSQQPDAAADADNPDYQKLGGWLLFFLIMWGIGALDNLKDTIGGLAALGAFFSRGPQFVVLALSGLLGALLTVGISALMIVLVINRNQNFLRVYQICSIVSIVVNVITSILSNITLSGYGNVSISLFSSSTFGGVIGLFLMTLYFCRSKRVQAYMGSKEYLYRALFNFEK